MNMGHIGLEVKTSPADMQDLRGALIGVGDDLTAVENILFLIEMAAEGLPRREGNAIGSATGRGIEVIRDVGSRLTALMGEVTA